MSTVRTRPAASAQLKRAGTRRRRDHRNRRAGLIRKLVERDGCQCVWCGTPLADWGEEVTVDHLIPRSVCHSMRPANLVLSCATCNHERGDMAPDAWAHRAQRLELTPNLRAIERALDITASMGVEYSPHAAAQRDAVRRMREGAVLDSLDVVPVPVPV